MKQNKKNKNIQTKIIFNLKVDESGYPPVGTESLWATSTKNIREFIVCNIPFYSDAVSLGDLIVIKNIKNEKIFYKVKACSGNSTIRIYCGEPDILSRIKQELLKHRCSWEISNLEDLISVNIPKDVSINKVIGLVKKYKRAYEDLEYEDGCIQHAEYDSFRKPHE